MARVPRTKEDLERQLERQLILLERSAETFDMGHEDEAVRLATIIRVLVHDSPNPRSNTRSLLGQLGLKSLLFWDTANPITPGNLLPHNGLTAMRLFTDRLQYIAPLDSRLGPPRQVGFDEWWTMVVFSRPEGGSLSRRDIVRTAADQDGGAHVDSELDEDYSLLQEGSYTGWKFGTLPGQPDTPDDAGTFMDGAERAAIRQIAHEVLKVLKPGYSKQKVPPPVPPGS